MQVKLLRVLQNRQVERVGGTRSLPIDVRIIAGSKRDIKQMVGEGRFREDLYFRLNVLPIALPPLRERRDDIPLLVKHFLELYARDRAVEVPAVPQEVLDVFARYDWPGNVRELENACERMIQTNTCGTVRVGCVAATILFGASGGERQPGPSHDRALARPISLDDRLRQVESNLIGWALRMTGGNRSKAAALLSIKRSTLCDRIARCGMEHGEETASPEATWPAGEAVDGIPSG
jgi:transcriptional regulator with PAS, ATPase and Fis domain